MNESLLPEPVSPDVIRASFAATRTYRWHQDEGAKRFGRMGAAFGFTGMIVAAVAVAGAASLFPLKTREDHIWFGDRSTGAMMLMPSFEQAAREAPWATKIWFAERYVEAREGWVYDDAKRNYDIVEWSSGTEVRNEYEHMISEKNPNSPKKVLGRNGSIVIDVYGRDPQCDSSGRCSVRVYFHRRVRYHPTDDPPKPETWAANISFEVRPDLVPPEGRDANPLGLIVTHYHAEEYPTQ